MIPGGGLSKTVRDERSDGQLIALVRGGNSRAFDELYRRHRAIAIGTAHNILDNSSDVEDVVADSFAYLFSKLREGHGPDSFFRGYILTAVRRNCYARNRASSRTRLSETDEVLDRPVVDPDRLIEEFESVAIVKAFSQLPERWQSVLWYLDVEQEPTQTVAARMGMTANSVSALVMRARDGLRAGYLQQHMVIEQDPACKSYVTKLAKYAAKTLSLPVRTKVENHLNVCGHCTAVLVNLRDSAPALRAALVPALAGISWLVYQGVASTAPAASSISAALAHGHGGLRKLVPHLSSGFVGTALTSAASVAVAMVIPAFLVAPISQIQPSLFPPYLIQSALPGEQGQVGALNPLPPADDSTAAKPKTAQPAKVPGALALAPSVVADQPSATIPNESTAGSVESSQLLPSDSTPMLPADVSGTPGNQGAPEQLPSTSQVPATPAAPVTPTVPVTPSNPTTPEVPVEPETPVKPTNPTDSTDPGNPQGPNSPTGPETPATEAPVASSSTQVTELPFGARKLVTSVVFPAGVMAKTVTVAFELDAFSMFAERLTESPEGWVCNRSNLRHYSCTTAEVNGTAVFELVATYPGLSKTPSMVVNTSASNLQTSRQETAL